MNHPLSQGFARIATALGLSLMVTLTTLGSLNQLATEQHAATVLAKATAVQQVRQALAAPSAALRS